MRFRYIPGLFILLALLLLPLCASEVGISCEIPWMAGIFQIRAASAVAGEDIYLAEYGNDAESGSFEAPLRTLREALYRLTQRKNAEEVTVWMMSGTYVVDESLFIGDHMLDNVSFRAAPGETPVITGAVPVTGWTENSLMGRIVWTAPLQAKSLRALYGDDGPRQISRWPKEGTLKAKGPLEKAENKFDMQQGFYANAADLPASLTGATLRLVHWWKDELSDVMWSDSSTGLVALNRPMSMTVAAGDRYWFENVMGLSMDPGEWAYDAVNGMISYAPREGETIGSTPLYAGVTERLLTLTNASNVTFEGITFARTGWSIPLYGAYSDFPQAAYDVDTAILINAADNITFTGCTFRDIGAGCVRFDYNVRDSVVTGCLFENIGAQAVYVHGRNVLNDPMATTGISIDNNHVSGYGKNFLNAAAVLIVHANGVTVANNEIHNGTYTAISAGWVWGSDYNATYNISIRDNWLYNIGQSVLSDMGAIYLLGVQPGTVVSGNVIHDVNSFDYGGWGIYLDEGSDSITVTNNLVYRCSAQGFHQHSGGYNTVVNNIFAFNLDGQVGASGPGTFLLDKNILAGGSYLKKIDGGTIQVGSNVEEVGEGLFVDAAGGNFSVIDSPVLQAKGFVPWVYMAGRYFSF